MPSFPWLLRPGSKTPYLTPACHACCMPLAPWSDFKSEMTASMSGTFFWGGKCLEQGMPIIKHAALSVPDETEWPSLVCTHSMKHAACCTGAEGNTNDNHCLCQLWLPCSHWQPVLTLLGITSTTCKGHNAKHHHCPISIGRHLPKPSLALSLMPKHCPPTPSLITHDVRT